jgi:hypothetical protein
MSILLLVLMSVGTGEQGTPLINRVIGHVLLASFDRGMSPDQIIRHFGRPDQIREGDFRMEEGGITVSLSYERYEVIVGWEFRPNPVGGRGAVVRRWAAFGPVSSLP